MHGVLKKNLYPTVILVKFLFKLKFSPNPNRFVRFTLKTALLLKGLPKNYFWGIVEGRKVVIEWLGLYFQMDVTSTFKEMKQIKY